MEERMLVKRAKRGDVDAFGELYQRIYKKLYAYALYTLKNPEDAEDAVSQAVVDAYQSIGQLKKDEAFSNWMYRIVANKCNRKMREFYHVGGELTQEVLEEKSLEMNPSDDEREMRFDVKEAFDRLDKEERKIVGLHAIFGYTTKEIAKLLMMNESTVRSKKMRALKKLEADLGLEK